SAVRSRLAPPHKMKNPACHKIGGFFIFNLLNQKAGNSSSVMTRSWLYTCCLCALALYYSPVQKLLELVTPSAVSVSFHTMKHSHRAPAAAIRSGCGILLFSLSA